MIRIKKAKIRLETANYAVSPLLGAAQEASIRMYVSRALGSGLLVGGALGLATGIIGYSMEWGGTQTAAASAVTGWGGMLAGIGAYGASKASKI
jgi:hypothetical protein